MSQSVQLQVSAVLLYTIVSQYHSLRDILVPFQLADVGLELTFVLDNTLSAVYSCIFPVG